MADHVRPILPALGIFLALIAGSAAATAAGSASTGTPIASSRESVSISNNDGGMIAHFALQLVQFRNHGTLVKFSGRCDSACTLFLSLPEHQTCIASGAYFRFPRSVRPILPLGSFGTVLHDGEIS